MPSTTLPIVSLVIPSNVARSFDNPELRRAEAIIREAHLNPVRFLRYPGGGRAVADFVTGAIDERAFTEIVSGLAIMWTLIEGGML